MKARDFAANQWVWVVDGAAARTRWFDWVAIGGLIALCALLGIDPAAL
jgi:hypothetical protein